MKAKDILKKYGAYAAAIVLFVAAALIYCRPALNGQTVKSGDGDSWVGASQEVRTAAGKGEASWWTGSMFSGMPNYQIGGGASYKADSLLSPVTKILNKPMQSPIWTLIFYFTGFFILLLGFGISPWISLIGAFAIGLSSYFLTIIPAGHLTKALTISLTAVVMGGFGFIFRKKYILGAILTMLFISAGYDRHPQMFYYFYMLLGMLWIAELWIHVKEKRIKDLVVATLVFVLATCIGIGTKSSSFLVNLEYAAETTRGGSSELTAPAGTSTSAKPEVASGSRSSKLENKGVGLSYATQFSYGLDESFSMLIPGLKGGTSTAQMGTDSHMYKAMKEHNATRESIDSILDNVPVYWGGQPFTAGNVYAGAIICFLFLLGALIVGGPYKWMLLAATLFSFALALGSNCMWLTKLFFRFFPMYSKFRAVSSILVVAEVTMPLLGMLAVKAILEGQVEKKKLLRSLFISGGVTAGICLFFGLLGGSIMSFSSPIDVKMAEIYPDWLMDAMKEDRKALLVHDSFRSMFFILGAMTPILLHAYGKCSKALLSASLGILIVVDLWGVDRRYFSDYHFMTPKRSAQTFTAADYEKTLLQDKDKNFRVLNLTTDTYNESRTSFYFKSIGGYSSAKLKRYNDLIQHHLKPLHSQVINMLNAKYIIQEGEDGNPVATYNPRAFGNAWWVSDIKFVDGAQQESDALVQEDLRRTAVVDRSFASFVSDEHPGIAANASVELVKYTPKSLYYNCSSPRPGTIVFSEIYYPHGWKVTIDQEPVEHFRADYTLRALNVPAGNHRIVFTFDPDSVRKGDAIAMTFIILMYLLTFAGLAYGTYNIIRKKTAKK